MLLGAGQGRAGQGCRFRAVSVWMSSCVCVSVASSWHGRPCSTMAMALPRNRQRPAPEPCTAHAHHRPGQAIIRHRANDRRPSHTPRLAPPASNLYPRPYTVLTSHYYGTLTFAGPRPRPPCGNEPLSPPPPPPPSPPPPAR